MARKRTKSPGRPGRPKKLSSTDPVALRNLEGEIVKARKIKKRRHKKTSLLGRVLWHCGIALCFLIFACMCFGIYNACLYIGTLAAEIVPDLDPLICAHISTVVTLCVLSFVAYKEGFHHAAADYLFGPVEEVIEPMTPPRQVRQPESEEEPEVRSKSAKKKSSRNVGITRADTRQGRRQTRSQR